MSITEITKERRNDIMGSKIDRTGEVGHNTFGSKMLIVDYRKMERCRRIFPRI